MPDAFCGWFREGRRSPWRKVASAESSDAAWQALLKAIAGLPSGDCQVLSADEQPIGRTTEGSTCPT